jgi:hypothetical protein
VAPSGWTRRQRQRLAVLSAAQLSLFVLAGCGGGRTAAGVPTAGPGNLAAPVEVTTIAEKVVPQATKLVGTLKSRRPTTVQSQIEGFVLEINIKLGDRVFVVSSRRISPTGEPRTSNSQGRVQRAGALLLSTVFITRRRRCRTPS